MNYWTLLPREVSLTLLAYLPPSSLWTLSKVSQSLLDLTMDPFLWRNLVVDVDNFDIEKKSHFEMASMAYSVTFNRSQTFKVRDHQIGQLIGKLNIQNLTSLSINETSGEKQQWLSYWENRINQEFMDFANLKKLEIQTSNKMSFEVLFSKLYKLECVKCTKMSEKDCISLSKNNSQLTHLSISASGNLTDASIKMLAKQWQNLKELCISKCWQVSDKGIAEIALNCPKLVVVDVNGCQVTDKGVISLAANCKGLTTLNLNYCTLITDRGIGQVAANCRGLVTLNLLCCNLITDIGVCHLAENCRRLVTLHLTGCSKITDEGVGQILTKCRRLIQFHLVFCPLVTDEVLNQVTRMCPRLGEVRNGVPVIRIGKKTTSDEVKFKKKRKKNKKKLVAI